MKKNAATIRNPIDKISPTKPRGIILNAKILTARYARYLTLVLSPDILAGNKSGPTPNPKHTIGLLIMFPYSIYCDSYHSIFDIYQDTLYPMSGKQGTL